LSFLTFLSPIPFQYLKAETPIFTRSGYMLQTNSPSLFFFFFEFNT